MKVVEVHHRGNTFLSFKFKMETLTSAYCAGELKKVDDKIETLKSRHYELLDKQDRGDTLTSREKAELANLAELKAEKKDWIELLKEAQRQQQGLLE